MSEVLSEDDFRDLIERAHQIRELTRHPGWEYFTDWLAYRVRSAQGKLLGGDISDINDYKLQAGIMRGVQLALHAADDTQLLVDNERARRDPPAE